MYVYIVNALSNLQIASLSRRFCGLCFATGPEDLWCLFSTDWLSTLSVAGQPTASSANEICLDDFDLVRVIGRGSYAKVFVVRQKQTQRVYAMKVIKKELVNDDEVG